MPELISVIIPVYNGKKYIREAVKSVQSATYSNLEILLIDDGSKDDSLAILRELAEADNRIVVFTKENGGIADTRTFGLLKATGEYVCFMDQDDIVCKDAYEILLRNIKDTGCDYAQGQVGHLYGDVEKDVCLEDKVYVYSKDSEEYRKCIKYLVWKGCHEEIAVPLIVGAGIYMNLFRKSFLIDNEIRIRNYCDYEDDWVFGAETLVKANSVCVNTKTTYMWRIHDESTLHKNIFSDNYIDNLYEKYCGFRQFMLECLEKADISEEELRGFKQEQARQTLLWCLSNETGRGIEGRRIDDSIDVISSVLECEKEADFLGEPLKVFNPLSMSGYGTKGIKWIYHKLRDVILIAMLKMGLVKLPVVLNKKIFHGRWHI